MNQDKRVQTRRAQEIKTFTYDPQPIITTENKSSSPRIAFPLMLLTIAGILFLLAYAGADIGNILAYLTVPLLAFFPTYIVWERYGKVAGILAGVLFVAVLAPAYGASLIANYISFFTSLQKLSQGILLMLALGALVSAGISFFTASRRN